MPSKKPVPVFEVVFTGPGVYPEAIPLGTLSRILSAVHRLATGSEQPEDEEESPQNLGEGEQDIQLLDVKRGSARLLFSGKSPEHVLRNLREVGVVLRNPERIGENVRILNPIELLSTTAKRLCCSIIIKKPMDGDLAKIEPGSFEAISQSAFVYGDTAITGFVERVGGAHAIKCGLRVDFQRRMLICKVLSREIARILGERVYQQVVVGGRASWIKSSWHLYGFEIRSVQQLDEGSVSDGMEALRNAGGAAWDKIANPEAFLEETGLRQ